MNTSASVLLQNSIKQDRCRVLVKTEPNLEDLSLLIRNYHQQQYTTKSIGKIETSLFYPSQMNDYLCVMAFDHELAKIDLDKIRFDRTADLTQEKTYYAKYLENNIEISVYFELQLAESQQQQTQEYITIDLSVSGLPIRQKCFSCFPTIPLAFYEIISLKQSNEQKLNKDQEDISPNQNNILYQSEITRLPSEDPVWMPCKKLNKLDLQPQFRVNVYNSSDQLKSRQQLIGGCDIDYQTVIEGKEFMFEMDGLENTHVLIDRIQIVQ